MSFQNREISREIQSREWGGPLQLSNAEKIYQAIFCSVLFLKQYK